MPYVEKVSPFTAPNYDVFSPARHEDPLGTFVGAPLDGGQSYTPWIGLSTVRKLALEFSAKTRVVDEEEHQNALDELHRLQDEVEQMRARVAELEANEERIAGLSRSGFKVQKVMGRPKKETE